MLELECSNPHINRIYVTRLNQLAISCSNTGTHTELSPIRRKYFPELNLDLSEFKFQEFKQNDFDLAEDSSKDLITSSSSLRLLGSATLHKLDTDTDESLSAINGSVVSSKLSSSSSSSSTTRCSILLGRCRSITVHNTYHTPTQSMTLQHLNLKKNDARINPT